jgi:nitrate reductase beta subunit
VWTSREGMEYAWFNNVETKPGIGYPKDWENQARWKGGWKRKRNGSIEPRIGGKWRVLANIFANPDLPEIDDYYEPFTFDYQHLQHLRIDDVFTRQRELAKRPEKIRLGDLIRIHLQNMDKRARKIQIESDPSNAGTKHLGG